MSRSPHRTRGFSLVELMVSMVIGLVILAALVSIFVNTSTSNREMARANTLIENGRLAIELLSQDVVHAGYWGGYIPRFDDQTNEDVPTDVPTAVPNPCLSYTTPWSAPQRLNLLHIPLQVYDSNATCSAIVTNKAANTDVLIVRHAELCAAGEGTCPDVADDTVYFQTGRCAADTTPYAFGTEDDAAFALYKMDCLTGAEMRKFIQHIYYVRNYAVTTTDGIPTLMRSEFDTVGGTPTQLEAQPVVEGIQGFHVELGVDNRSEAYAGQPTGTPVDYTDKVIWLDPSTRTTPTNRGDGAPDGNFVSCTTGTPCTVAQLDNVTAVQIYVLVRSRDPSPGYTDTKTYTLGSKTMGPYNDGFKRHVYVSTIRLPNIAGRRQTP